MAQQPALDSKSVTATTLEVPNGATEAQLLKEKVIPLIKTWTIPKLRK